MNKDLAKLIKTSIIASFVSFAMLITAAIFTVSHTIEVDQQLIKNTEDVVYDHDDLVRQEEEFIKSLKEMDNDVLMENHMSFVKNQSIFYIWLPWFLLPFFISIKHRYLTLSTILIPAIFYFFNVVEIQLVIACALSLIIGIELKYIYTKKHITRHCS